MNRDEFLDAVETFVGPDADTGSWDVLLDALDEYTRSVKAAVLREAADEVGMHISLRLRADWLRDRADRIEKEADRDDA